MSLRESVHGLFNNIVEKEKKSYPYSRIETEVFPEYMSIVKDGNTVFKITFKDSPL